MALAEAGCTVLAVESDPGLVPALGEVLASHPSVRIEVVDAMRADWGSLVPGSGWVMVSNLPYHISVPLLVEMLDGVPAIVRYLVMVQREVGDRLAAAPGTEPYGAVSLRVAYRAEARIVRRVPASVFWPPPRVDSVLLRLVRRPPPVEAEPAALFRVIEEGFAERRKTIGNAIRRLGLSHRDATHLARACDVDPAERAERLGLEAFDRIVRALLAEGWRP